MKTALTTAGMRTLPGLARPLALGLCAALLTAGLIPEAEAGPRRSIRRRHDQVVMEGKDVKPMLGLKIENLRLLALSGSELETIPFQIDERTPAGNYAFSKGSDTKRDTDGGSFDANDELVFMVRDSGGKADPGQLEALWKVVEIEVTDPLDKRKGWVYLAAYKTDPPALSKVDYVSISFNENGLLTYNGKGFILDNARALGNAVRTTTLRFQTKDGQFGPNLADSTKTRTELYYFAIPIRRNGTEMRVSIGAWIDGPVRVVALNVVEIYLIWGFWVRAPNSLIFFYDYGSEMPTNINMPVNVDQSPESGARLSLDLSPRAKGWFFYSDKNPSPLALDGKPNARKEKLDMSFPDWVVIYGPEGGVIRRMTFDKEIRKASKLYFVDDVKKEDAPENEKGSFGNTGFVVNLTGLKSKVYQGTYYTYYKANFRYGDEKRYLQIHSSPLVAKAALPGAAKPADDKSGSSGEATKPGQ